MPDILEYYPGDALERLVRAALDEDVGGAGDLTTMSMPRGSDGATAVLTAGAVGVISGLPVARAVFGVCETSAKVDDLVEEGSQVEAGQAIMRVRGSAAALLRGERTALNFLQLMSGIATLTSRFVIEAARFEARVYDTRKTHPMLRGLEKYAVRCGGGCNHRLNLSAAVLIKDNHLALAGGLTAAIEAARAQWGDIYTVEVEVDTLEQLREAMGTSADLIMLDNMSVEQVSEAVRVVAGRKELEASGGITLANIRAYTATGVGRVSVGALTMSSPALDISMHMQ